MTPCLLGFCYFAYGWRFSLFLPSGDFIFRWLMNLLTRPRNPEATEPRPPRQLQLSLYFATPYSTPLQYYPLLSVPPPTANSEISMLIHA